MFCTAPPLQPTIYEFASNTQHSGIERMTLHFKWGE
jgi:hypothetical protein